MAFSFVLKAKVWLYPGMAGWHFVSIDKKISLRIKKSFGGGKHRGWGSVPVEVNIGKTVWGTSIFPNKDGTYLLPVKSSVRKKEGILEGDTLKIRCTLKGL